MTDVITATLWITLGLTWYGDGFVDSNLACGGKFTDTDQMMWGALPIEWNKAGYVSCDDTLIAEFPTGRRIEVPVMDFGCHLHHRIWDGLAPSMGADFPDFPEFRQKEPTATGRMTVIRKDGTPWEIPPLKAWGGKWCDGPLTYRSVRPDKRR